MHGALCVCRTCWNLGKSSFTDFPPLPTPEPKISPWSIHLCILHFFSSLASIFYLTLKSCLVLLSLYGNIPYVPNVYLFIMYRNSYWHLKIGKSDIAMNTLRKYNLNRSKKAHFHIAIRSALQRENNCMKMFEQTQLDCKQAFFFIFILHSNQVSRFFFLLADVTGRPICGLFCQHGSLADNIFSSLLVALDIDLLYSSSWNGVCLFILSLLLMSEMALCSSSCLLLSAARDQLHLSESLCESQMGRDPEAGWFLKALLRSSPPSAFFLEWKASDLCGGHVLKKN